jgi:hypothetical protein
MDKFKKCYFLNVILTHFCILLFNYFNKHGL